MKKRWKVLLVTVGSTLGLVAIVTTVALWLLLTPTRLTSIVNKLSDKYILCESHFESVDLTLIKTFPYIGLKVDDVTLIYSMYGAKSDTVTSIGSVCVGFNLREYLRNGNIEVTKLVVENVDANLYTDSSGCSNYDVWRR